MAEDTHRTSDIFYAAFLRLSGVEMLGLEPTPDKPGIFHFLFRKNPSIRTLHAAYFNGTGVIAAKPFVEEVKNLRTLIRVKSPGSNG